MYLHLSELSTCLFDSLYMLNIGATGSFEGKYAMN